MSAIGSKLVPLLSTHDLQLVCPLCCVEEKEISYRIRSAAHRCERSLLLCRTKGANKWRPISRRPTIPNPSRYEVCLFFREGLGCTVHKNRCTFARSAEEAAVWTFEKHQRLNHVLLCQLVAQWEGRSDQPGAAPPPLLDFTGLDLKAACHQCSRQKGEITYAVLSVHHKCSQNLLLVRAKGSELWRPVSERPAGVQFGRNTPYQKCHYFVEGSGCTRQGQSCTFARSQEEAVVWNHFRNENIDLDQQIKRVTGSESSSVKPQNSAQNILQEFSGEFLELCKTCFHDRPQKLTPKRWNPTCAADAAHGWEPVLLHHLSESNGKHIYNQVRSLPQNCQLDFCSHVSQGKPCWHQARRCQSAHSEVEMMVWKAERGGLAVRPYLLHLSRRERPETAQKIYCKACLVVLDSPEKFYEHCSSPEHAQLLSADSATQWTGRRPPHYQRDEFRLCERPETCEYGDNCPKAHSQEELQEWRTRAADEQEIRQNMEVQGLLPYNQRLMEEYRSSSDEEYILSEHIDDVCVSCDEELSLSCDQTAATLTWNFQVETERQLFHVALLKQEPGASFTLGGVGSVPCIYSSGEQLPREDITYEITVSFSCDHPGLYEQWLVLDFDMRPALLKKLRVRVGRLMSDDGEEQTANRGTTVRNAARWHPGNRVIVPCLPRTEEQEELLKQYQPPQISVLYKSAYNSRTPLREENYRERMHHFLYREEQAEDRVVSRLNVCGEMSTLNILSSEESGMMIAPVGQVFCAVSIPYSLTPDTPEGQVLKRSIRSALIAPSFPAGQNSKVYEASILQGKTVEGKMYLEISKQCCSDLNLKSNESYQMEVQFQLSRYKFCAMHKAVDLLPETKRVLPDLQSCGVPENNIRCEKLNAKQQAAFDFINGKVQKFVAPLLIYGPFGTGKTFTLATAARELWDDPDNKVLVCTHTNSSADLYVREHFHPFLRNDGWKMCRIKANTPTALSATDEITLKYCLLSENRQTFLPPTEADLDRPSLVITTTSLAIHFHDLKLPEGFFTHILIDEASQMLECEALIAIGLAGPVTRVVLAGDHMQMGPKLFSVDDHHRSDYTLLNRLFHCYQGQKCDTAQKSRIIFNENYRSTKEIVDFVSTHFYVGKNDIIKAAGNVPPPANDRALRFHHVRGECLFQNVSMSWWNKEEIAEVLQEVEELLEHWPLSWGPKTPSSICVLSEGCQVRQIRTSLSRRGLPDVHVENIANVQGKQFRAVIMTAVHTRDGLRTSHLPGLELFNDARVLNTAMTRAQSLVVVVGDAAALCCFGKCSGVWKSYIDHCISNNSVAPQHFTKDLFEKDVTETGRFQKSEDAGESNTLSDAILQELKDKYEELETEYCSDEDNLELDNFVQDDSRLLHDSSDDINAGLLELCAKQPQIYKQGTFSRVSHNRGYVIPLHDSSIRLPVHGKANLHGVFTGDEVVLKATEVLCITKEDKSARLLVCQLEDEDYSKPRQNVGDRFVKRTMKPLDKSAPRVKILIIKEKRNFLPVWKLFDGWCTVVENRRMNERLKQNNVFLVQVVCWKEYCPLPLGKVIDIIPVGKSLDDGLRILDEELKVGPTICPPVEGFSRGDANESDRKDLRKVITFTVDPASCFNQHPQAKDLDDAISVSDIGDNCELYEFGVHIADVASFVNPGCELDKVAKQRGSSYFSDGGKTSHMFPSDISGRFSLQSGNDRKVISLILQVNKQTNEIVGKPQFQLSQIISNRQLSYQEAEKMISERAERPRFDTVEDCVRVAYCFAKAQRKKRLQDWVYAQTDHHRLPGKRLANLMIEEANVLFNRFASEALVGSDKTKFFTPLRCQAKPDPEKIKELREKKCAELIPLSFHLRHKVKHDGQDPNFECFRILTSVWKDIQSAARSDAIDKMVDLIAADDIHPLLQPVIDEFKRCSGKAYIIRSNSSPNAMVGHYSLNVSSYTQASSPIRRYMDIVLQRLLHAIICDKNVPYSQPAISTLCNQFERAIKNAKVYEQKAEQISFAVSTKSQSSPKLAFVVGVNPDTESFAVSFPFNKNLFTERLQIKYKSLQLLDQPVYDEDNHFTTLTWKRVIYGGVHSPCPQPTTKLCLHLTKPHSAPCVELPLTIWKATVKAIDEEDWNLAKSLILNVDTSQSEKQNIVCGRVQSSEVSPSKANRSFSEELQVQKIQFGLEVDINLQLREGDTLHVQMTSEIKRGYQMPAVQLVRIASDFEICVDHVQGPVQCFSRYADDSSRNYYSDPEVYVQIWKPLCEMESASVAVDEGDSLIIDNLVVHFRKEGEDVLTGNFFLPMEWIEEWGFESSLSRCLLCIRKSRLKLADPPKDAAALDPTEYTWVAHGVTRKVEWRKTHNKGGKVEFSVNHLPMETIPDCVFQKDSSFTVEIIPKLLPDIRKENAVVRLPNACDLIQAIVLGQHIPREVQASWNPTRRTAPAGLPQLNQSQIQAVDKALNGSFTVIQGPPGTGKTIVGVYIVYRLFELNARYPRTCVDPKDKEKKQVILYCGPSNKSVDVVAAYLLKFKDSLKPLRVYSQQVEMLDYPYPVSTVQFSRQTLRQERAKSELRSITLHHLLRKDLNPFSSEIKDFDRRIQRAREEHRQLSNEEVKEYEKLLRNAREHELKRHDVILCTCTQSSTPAITKAVSARQILIDECAMATEPQALIPLVCNHPEKVILIGDHKQLRPIVRNACVKKLGMARSLFERYHIMYKKRIVMLDTQYRMHEDICEFPSVEYYEGHLKTGTKQPSSVLRVEGKTMPIVFGDIEGTTVSLVVPTAKGNENSKANKEERIEVIHVAEMLVNIAKIEQKDIVILSPYNAQVCELKNELQENNMHDITVTTITKSQGSEWRYVIISTVCSLPTKEIEKEPNGEWLSKHLGFVGDPNQINVGITRAKEGLCIIGNQALLSRGGSWRKLLKYYGLHGAVTTADRISVHQPV